MQAKNETAKQAVSWSAQGDKATEEDGFVLAVTCFTEVIQRMPNNARAHYKRGLAHAARGDRDSAVADYTEAIRLQPDFAASYNRRGLNMQQTQIVASIITTQ